MFIAGHSRRIGFAAFAMAASLPLCACGVLTTGATDAGGSPPLEAHESINARVLRVVDGDTIEVLVDGERDDVRYIGIDTPETVDPDEPVGCFGKRASKRNHELVDGREVRLEFDEELRDIYGRLLAYVYVDDKFVNEKLLAGGFAHTLRFPPNTSKAQQLAAVEKRASADGRGLWSAC